MNLTKEQWQKVISIILGAALAVFAVLGWVIEPVSVVAPEVGVEPKAAERQSLLCATEAGNCVESWNGSDFYIYSDVGSTQKYHVDGATGNVDAEGTGNFAGAMTLQSALSADGATTLNSTLDVDGNLTSGTGAITVTDNVILDGAADVVQLTVQGYTTQTSSLLVLGNSSGVDKLTVSNDGNVDITGTLRYGANDLYALGHASSGQQVVYGTSAVTGTESVAHGLTTVTFCIAVLGEDPKTGGGEAAFVTVAVTGNACTVKVWQDDWTSAATETEVVVQWLVIGAP